MAIIDNDGRLFARINVIDATLVLLALLALPVSMTAYRMFTARRPAIARVEPSVLAVDGDRRLRLEGAHFRPYLKAFFFPSGAPVSLTDPQSPDSGRNQATFLLDTQERVELTLPPAPPGAYDLYLYDEGQEVARRMTAFTIVPRGEQPGGLPAAGVALVPAVPIEIAVRFRIDSAIANLVKAGDVGLPDAASPGRPPLLESLRAEAATPDLSMQLAGARMSVSTSGTAVLAEGVVRLGALRTNGVWHTAAALRIRAGELFSFETATYVITGLITRLTVLPPPTADREARP